MGCIVIPCPTQSSPANIVSTLTTQLLYMWPRSPVSVGYNSHGVIFLAHRTEHTAVSALELARVDEIHGVNLVRGNPRKPDSSQLDCKFVHADSLRKNRRKSNIHSSEAQQRSVSSSRLFRSPLRPKLIERAGQVQTGVGAVFHKRGGRDGTNAHRAALVC